MLLYSFTFSFLVLINPVVAQTIGNSNILQSNQELQEKIFIALLAALLGFIFNLILESIRRSREARRQISYQKIIKFNAIELAKELTDEQKKNIEISYKTHPVNNLAIVFFIIQNSGNRDIKEQYIRLGFPKDTRIREDSIEAKEGIECEPFYESNLKPHEKAYKFKYLPQNEEIKIRFIVEVTENQKIDIEPFWKNEIADDVNYLSAESKQVRDERDVLQRFIILCLCFFLIPLLFSEFGTAVSIFIVLPFRLILLGLMLPLISTVTKIVSDLILKFSLDRQNAPVSNLTFSSVKDSTIQVISAPGNLSTFSQVISKSPNLSNISKSFEFESILEDIRNGVTTDKNLNDIDRENALKALETLLMAVNNPELLKKVRTKAMFEDLKEILAKLPESSSLAQKRNLLPKITDVIEL